MASIEVLYACTNCHQKFSLEELSSSQHLCKPCRKKFPSVQCIYCQLDFYQLDKSGKQTCEQCTKELKQYGQPNQCSICNMQSAFKGDICTRCNHSQKKYGLPVVCDHCHLRCAFIKSTESKKKVNGKTLCLICTMNYKRAMFRKKEHHDKLVPPAGKKPRFDTPTTKSEMDPLSNELMQQTETLRSELNGIKKTLALKEQQLIEKDKTICTLKAENLERDKDYRMKIHSLNKQNSDTVEELKLEIQSLKKQLSHKSRTKPPTSSL